MRNASIVFSFFVFIALITFPTVHGINCKMQPEIYKCGNNSSCNDNGICVCNSFYYGSTCEKLLAESNDLTIYTTGITLSSYIGLIVGLVISFPTVLIVGLLIIYFALKDRDY